jgi:hypothetical protein
MRQAIRRGTCSLCGSWDPGVSYWRHICGNRIRAHFLCVADEIIIAEELVKEWVTEHSAGGIRMIEWVRQFPTM